MKSYRIIIAAFFFSLLTAGLNAQVFVGGSFGVSLSGGKYDNGSEVSDRPSSLDFSLSPKIGKFLSEKTAVGVALNFGYSRDNNNADIEHIDMSSSYGVSPFLRYYAITAGKFSVFGQGSLGFTYSSSKSKTGTVTTDGPQNTGFSLNFVPGLAFNVNDKIALEASINVLNFGVGMTTAKSGNTTTTTTSVNLGGGMNNIINTGNISIGAIYKF